MIPGGPTDFEVVEVGPDDARAAGEAAARGFEDNEIWCWILPNDRIRTRVLPRQYRSLVKHIFVPRRGAWMSRPREEGDGRGPSGTALWFPPGTKRLTVRESLAEALSFMPEGLPQLAKVGRLDKAVRARQPKQPHWYLSVLAVEPESQGRGHGSELIKPGLERADRSGSGAWLETQRKSNIAFYEHFGFELVEKVVVDDELPVWMLWRKPQKAASSS